MYIVYTTDSVAYKGEKVKKSLVESISKVSRKYISYQKIKILEKDEKCRKKSRILLNKTGKIADIIYRTRNRVKVVV